jgi:glucose-1-phosphate adenylyltransferase
MLGIVVAGGAGPLDDLGGADDAALTPFAGRYRFIDFALANLANSGVGLVYVVGPGSSAAAPLSLARGSRPVRRPRSIPPPGAPRRAPGHRAARLLRALAGCREVIRTHGPDLVVVLLADHILQLDLRQLADAHRALGAQLTLAAVPTALDDPRARPRLRVGDDCLVRGIDTGETDRPALGLTWGGDLALDPGALPLLLEAVPAEPPADDTAMLAASAAALRVGAYDVLASRVPGAAEGTSPYWHESTTLEGYYEAQMRLCTPRPPLDLHNAAWPVVAFAAGVGPAKIVADATGRSGQALNAILADGVVIQGGVVVNAVLGHGVTIESGAEVEDSVLLDGCRIGRGARVRRAVVGAGAVVADGEAIGYETPPPPSAHVRRSGLTLVPPAAALAAAAGDR